MTGRRASSASVVPRAFRTPAAFRTWLERHHADVADLTLRCFKVHAAGRGVTYGQALDEALCFGWIDGVRRSVDADSFSVRFSPRKPRSVWSRVNVEHAERLIRAGRMAAPGLAAFDARTVDRTGLYSFERPPVELPAAMSREFRADARAWAFFQSQPPGYRRVSTFWVTSARRDETRARRLSVLIECSARHQRIPALARPASRGRAAEGTAGPAPRPR